MKKKDLKKRIEELENLVKLQQETIKLIQIELDQKINYPTQPVEVNNVAVPFFVPQGDFCIDGDYHEYDNETTGGMICKKCGKSLPNYKPTITMETNSTDNTNIYKYYDYFSQIVRI